MLDWLKIFLDWRYWFHIPPPIRKVSLIILLGGAGGFILLAILCSVLKRMKKKKLFFVRVIKRFYVFFLTLGIASFIIIFFRYERIPVLGLRFWYIVWLVSAVVWLISILVYCFKKIRKEKQELEERKRFEKYLP